MAVDLIGALPRRFG